MMSDIPQDVIIAYGFIQPAYVQKNDIDVDNATQRHKAVVALDKQIKRLGSSTFSGARKPLTPYVFRHAFASEIKAFAMKSSDPDENVQDRSASMGHRSTVTIKRYGSSSAAQGGRGRRKPARHSSISVKTSSSVRFKSTDPTVRFSNNLSAKR